MSVNRTSDARDGDIIMLMRMMMIVTFVAVDEHVAFSARVNAFFIS